MLDDMNEALTKIFKDRPDQDDWTKDDEEAFRLYYVACTRCKFKLNNAAYIDYI